MASRIESAVREVGGDFARVDEPDRLPAASKTTLLIVDWSERSSGWGAALAAWRDDPGSDTPPRIVLFGPHTDLAAHKAAREAGLGPMRARSALFSGLPELLRT